MKNPDTLETTEFRIGNYLKDREGRICIVEELSSREGEREVYAPAMNGPITALPNKPIALSEDWLLKFGFKKQHSYGSTNLWTIKIKGLCFSIYEIPPFREDKEKPGKWALVNHTLNYDLHYKYVHQLQNLYFALTGEELKID